MSHLHLDPRVPTLPSPLEHLLVLQHPSSHEAALHVSIYTSSKNSHPELGHRAQWLAWTFVSPLEWYTSLVMKSVYGCTRFKNKFKGLRKYCNIPEQLWNPYSVLPMLTTAVHHHPQGALLPQSSCCPQARWCWPCGHWEWTLTSASGRGNLQRKGWRCWK